MLAVDREQAAAADRPRDRRFPILQRSLPREPAAERDRSRAEGEAPLLEATNGTREQVDRQRLDSGSGTAPTVAVVCGRVPAGLRRDAPVGPDDRDAPVRAVCGAVSVVAVL